MDTLKKPISCGDNFIYKKLQYQPLETPVSNKINWKGDWVGVILDKDEQVGEKEYSQKSIQVSRVESKNKRKR